MPGEGLPPSGSALPHRRDADANAKSRPCARKEQHTCFDPNLKCFIHTSVDSPSLPRFLRAPQSEIDQPPPHPLVQQKISQLHNLQINSRRPMHSRPLNSIIPPPPATTTVLRISIVTHAFASSANTRSAMQSRAISFAGKALRKSPRSTKLRTAPRFIATLTPPDSLSSASVSFLASSKPSWNASAMPPSIPWTQSPAPPAFTPI